MEPFLIALLIYLAGSILFPIIIGLLPDVITIDYRNYNLDDIPPVVVSLFWPCVIFILLLMTILLTIDKISNSLYNLGKYLRNRLKKQFQN